MGKYRLLPSYANVCKVLAATHNKVLCARVLKDHLIVPPEERDVNGKATLSACLNYYNEHFAHLDTGYVSVRPPRS
jgi:hypothetical protein